MGMLLWWQRPFVDPIPLCLHSAHFSGLYLGLLHIPPLSHSVRPLFVPRSTFIIPCFTVNHLSPQHTRTCISILVRTLNDVQCTHTPVETLYCGRSTLCQWLTEQEWVELTQGNQWSPCCYSHLMLCDKLHSWVPFRLLHTVRGLIQPGNKLACD